MCLSHSLEGGRGKGCFFNTDVHLQLQSRCRSTHGSRPDDMGRKYLTMDADLFYFESHEHPGLLSRPPLRWMWVSGFVGNWMGQKFQKLGSHPCSVWRWSLSPRRSKVTRLNLTSTFRTQELAFYFYFVIGWNSNFEIRNLSRHDGEGIIGWLRHSKPTTWSWTRASKFRYYFLDSETQYATDKIWEPSLADKDIIIT